MLLNMITAVSALTLLLILIKLLLSLNLTPDLRPNPELWGAAKVTPTHLRSGSVMDQLWISWWLSTRFVMVYLLLVSCCSGTNTNGFLPDHRNVFLLDSSCCCLSASSPPPPNYSDIYSSPPPHLSHPLLSECEGGTQHILNIRWWVLISYHTRLCWFLWVCL